MSKRLRSSDIRSNFTKAALIFAAVFLCFIFAALYTARIRADAERQELQYLAVNTANKVTKVITDRIWKSETLATLIVQGDGEIDDFEKIAAILVNDYSILNVTLAPDGIVNRIFPLQGNESVIGLDYLGRDGGSREARKALDSAKLTLAGPFKLIQGGEALTGRLPVFLEKGDKREFWGFVGIALAYPDVLESAYLEELYQHGYAGEIWRLNPATGEKQVIWHSSYAQLSNPQTREINLFNVTWNVSVGRQPDPLLWLKRFMYLFGMLFVSLLLGMLAYHYFELRKMKSALESMAMTDTLTGLPNRRALMNELAKTVEDARKYGRTFVIVYIDLNGFKLVNDTHGHEAGDFVLTKSAASIQNAVGNAGMVARVGGDEFIVTLPGYAPGERLDSLLALLDKAMRLTFPGKPPNENRSIQVSASMGVATFPEDGAEMQPLLHCADVRMFERKKTAKDTMVMFKSHFR